MGSNPTLSVSQSRRGNIGRTSVLFVLIGGKINEITVHLLYLVDSRNIFLADRSISLFSRKLRVVEAVNMKAFACFKVLIRGFVG